MKTSILPMFVIFLLFSCLILGILTYVPDSRLQASFAGMWATFETITRTVILITGVTLSLSLLVGLLWLISLAYSHSSIWRYESQLRGAATLKAKREAGHMVTVAPPGSQVYFSDVTQSGLTLTHKPGHLSPGWINGQLIELSPDEVNRWSFYQLHQSINKPPKVINTPQAPQLEAGLQPILPVLLKAQRLIIGGGSDSGKSTLIKYLIAGRAEDSQIVAIDPHSPSKILGFDVIGAGRDFEAIGQALESLELLMHERYGEVAKGLAGYFTHSRLSVFIDEWISILENIPDAGKRLKTLLVESRKVNMFLCLLTHSTTLDGLGLPSAQLKKSALIVELIGGQDQQHRAFVHPQTNIGVDGKRARPVEYALPGPFTGYLPAREKVLLELPSPEIIKIQKMADEGASRRAMCRIFFPAVSNPGKYHYDQIDALLERAKAAKEARLS